MQLLDIVFRHAFAGDPRCTLAGRGVFYGGNSDTIRGMSGGCEAWLGLQQVCARVCGWGCGRVWKGLQ